MSRIRIINQYSREKTGILDEFLRKMEIVRIPVSVNEALDTGEHIYQAVYHTIRREAKAAPAKMAEVLKKVDTYSIFSCNSQDRIVNLRIHYRNGREHNENEEDVDNFDYVKYCEKEDDVVEVLTCGIIETKKHICVIMPYDGNQMPEFHNYLEDAYNTHRQGCVNDGAYLKSHSQTGVDVARFLCLGTYMMDYKVEYRTTHEQEQLLMAEVDKEIHIMGLNRSGVAAYDKITEVYRYITKNVVYDYDYKRYSAYHAMIEHKAVCMGCAMLFTLFMRKLDVPVEYITGLALPMKERHAWNIVKLGMYWYNVDTTWEHYCVGKRIKITERNYFLKSDRDFKNHVREEAFLTEKFMREHPMSLKSI